MPELSYIIPFYNGADTIANCIDSIYSINMDIDAFEVIVIDDNSPNPAKDVLDKYLCKYHNLRLLKHTINTRQGGAKNTGIKAAKGEYIAFADQDDIIQPNNLLTALNRAIESNVDMLCCHYSIQDENDNIMEYGISTGDEMLITGKEFCENHFVTGYNLAPWANLYRRDFLLEVNHPFEENVVMEDSDWVAWHWIHSNSVKIWNHSIYTWIMNSKSITHSQHFINRADWIKIGYRKMRDSKIYENVSSSFADTMYQDGKFNVQFGFLKIWKVDSYSEFYKHIGVEILNYLKTETWKFPVGFMLKHKNLSCIILNIFGPILKIGKKGAKSICKTLHLCSLIYIKIQMKYLIGTLHLQ